MTNIKTVEEVVQNIQRHSYHAHCWDDVGLRRLIKDDRATTLTALCEGLEAKSTNSLVGYETEGGIVEMRLTKIITLDAAQAVARTILSGDASEADVTK